MNTEGIGELIQACEWAPSQFFIFSANVFDPLIYYSHFTALLLSLAFGLFVFIKNRTNIAAKLLVWVLVFLSIWLIGDLILWATEYSQITLFSWSVINLAEPFVYALSLYFVYAFIDKKDISFGTKLLIFLPLLPTILLTPTRVAMLGYDLANCDRDAIEGALVYYGYFLEVLYLLWIVILGFARHAKATLREQKQQILLVCVGIVLFLLSFAFGNIIGSLFGDLDFFGDYSWTIGQYGLFGVPVFIGLLSYLIVRFRAFNIGLIAVQALIGALFILLASEFAFVTTDLNRILVSITLILTIVLGYMLIKSVQREIKQREHIELLAKDLSAANERQVALIHFITHQIKGFVTKSRNAMAGILDGDYGQAPETMKPLVQQVFESDTQGVSTIQEILNASNIKSGKVTYTMQPFDLKGLIEEVVGTLKSNAEKKGLALNANLGEALTVTGDRAQLINAYKNIVDNSIKYTPKGSVTVSLEKKDGKALFTVTDTGVGISDEDKKNLFTEGGHGKESTKVNVDSTGFGLYIVKNIIEAHKGRVWAESDGPNKGSRFYIELPA
ncbi:MAG: two-component system, NarL family, sensor histidine kinase BarA [Parcubacteria bacterium C7867-001]|nr:MAG: two-component system, NarL family, sensor histidine kinase BarA [Parcubacteria bacterium C7867-001]